MYMLGGTVIMSLVCNIPAAINLLLIDEVRAGLKGDNGSKLFPGLWNPPSPLN